MVHVAAHNSYGYGLAFSLFDDKDVFYMTEKDVYAQRLARIGYHLNDATKIVDMHYSMGDLDALEDYISAKEAIQGVM